MSLQILISAIAPVILILLLGYAAGKHRSFDADQTKGFGRLALQYALPAALFLGMAHFDRQLLLRQGPVVIEMLVGYSAFFLVAYWVLRLLRVEKLKATLFSYTSSSTAVPIFGLTVLVPIYGQAVGTGVVGLAALVTNLAQVSIAVFLLQSASHQDSAPSVFATIGRSATNPLVWSPVLGAIFALLGWRLSPLVSTGLAPLAVSAAGIAIFASGLTLAAYPMKLTSRAVVPRPIRLAPVRIPVLCRRRLAHLPILRGGILCLAPAPLLPLRSCQWPGQSHPSVAAAARPV